MKAPDPDRVIYTDPRLAPGGGGPPPGPPEIPPAVSAYTGAPSDAAAPASLPQLLLPATPSPQAPPPGPVQES